MRKLPKADQPLWELLKSGLHATPPAVGSISWPELYDLSQRHGITALVWDGVRQLPSDRQPSLDLKLQWAVQTEHLEKRHRKQEAVAAEAAALFAGQGLRMLVLKGLGLSRYYPVAGHRECGDIDFWLFGDSEAGDRILQDAGAKVLADVPKHSELLWHGVMLENHRSFLNRSRSRQEARIDDVLHSLIQSEGVETAPGGYFTPSATFNAIYLLRHAALHFLKEGIVLRHVCDWACFWEQNSGKVDQKVFGRALRDFGMEHFARLMTAAAIRCCGLQLEMPAHDPQELERFLDEIIRYDTPKKTGNRLVTLLHKCRTPYENRWRFRLLGMSLTAHYGNVLRAQWREKFTLMRP